MAAMEAVEVEARASVKTAETAIAAEGASLVPLVSVAANLVDAHELPQITMQLPADVAPLIHEALECRTVGNSVRCHLWRDEHDPHQPRAHPPLRLPHVHRSRLFVSHHSGHASSFPTVRATLFVSVTVIFRLRTHFCKKKWGKGRGVPILEGRPRWPCKPRRRASSVARWAGSATCTSAPEAERQSLSVVAAADLLEHAVACWEPHERRRPAAA